jgi:PhnB protein
MPTKAKHPIPPGYEGCIPYLIVAGAAKALDFYGQAFGAVTVEKHEMPGGKVGHAEVRIGKALFMLADEYPEQGYKSPKGLTHSPVSMLLYVEDVDALARRAAAAGAKTVRAVADQFYGDRNVVLEDPFGHRWTFGTHKEDLTAAEMAARAQAQKG